MASVPTDSPTHDIARPLPSNSAEPPPDLTSSSSTPPSSHDASPTAVSGQSKRVLAVPVASITHPDPSQSSFVLSHAGNRAGEASASALPSDVGKADLHISADGSFVQTSSAHAARELKKAYDLILRENLGAQGGIRSPYAITAVQDASGNAVFRIGYREPSVDTPETAETPSEPSSSYSPGHAAGPRRKARLSVQDFLPSSMFKPNASGSALPRNTSSFSSGSAFTPPNTSSPPAHHTPRNKLRKQRSNSDLHLRGTSNPPQSSATASGEGAVPVSPPPRSESFAIEIRDEITAGADAFSQVLAWSSELVTDSVPPSRKSSKASNPPAEEQQDGLAPAIVNSALSRRPSVSTSAALSTSTGDIGGSPFGENVRYTAPMRRSAIFLAPKAPQLREVQSFESGLTARIGDDKETSPGTPKSKTHTVPKKDGEEVFLVAKNQARFSTSVFDVLQTYRGLPLPNTLSELSTGATIKLSTTDSPNPKDDPRFVIWGELQGEISSVDDASLSHSQSSHTDLSASISTAASSRKRSNARPPHANNDTPSLGVSSEFTNKTVMIAATVERWIAQLTSELNYDELLNFLLTYRTYIAPVDLCHLLICRFHWALEPPRQHEDSTVRNIVRFRTFIAIRYWLLTFFREDFLPNPELCHLFASWLNTLFRDPALAKHADALSMVRKLKKIVRECKAAHSRHGRAGLGRPSMESRSTPYTSANGTPSQGVAGKKANGEKAGEEIDDSDVDLDFSPEANAHYTDYSANAGTIGALHQISESDGQNASSPIRPPVPIPPVQDQAAATPSANSILLSQPLSMAILGHVKSMGTGTDMPLTQMPSSLPVQHSAISRAFVNTIGRLGRWKRVLNSRPGAPPPLCGDVSAYDLELNATGDLLFVRGGVEEYLKMLNISPQILPTPSTPSETSVSHRIGESSNPVRPPGLGPSSGDEPTAKAKMSRPNSLHLDALDEEGENFEQQITPQTRERDTHNSVTSETTDTSDSLASTGFSYDVSGHSGWTPEIVSLDDYDLSDSDSSSRSPARVRRLPRRLPLRRDFQFVRRSIDTVSSMGIRSHSSLTSSMKSGSASGSIRYSSRGSDMSEGRSHVIGIQNWQIELIDTDDEDEAGDAEAALRRLEGQIDVDRQREKDMKVGRWLRTARQRDQDSTSSSIRSGSLVSEEGPEKETNEEATHDQHDGEDVTVSMGSVRSSAAETAVSMTEATPLLAADSTRTITSGTVTAPPTSKPPGARDRSGSVESVQMQTSRPTSRRTSLLGKTSRGPQPSKFSSPNVPALHRSFILMHRSETLAQQFAIIEAELFAKVKFEELISHQWGQSPEDVNVKDWGQFVKERARLKNTGSSSTPDRAVRAKLSAILALRARFNLLVNFTASEVLLTHSSGRVIVVEKFIRIAWKAYLHNNFSTLVALMAGLQTRWVNLAMSRHWHKVGMREQRIFDDLRKFTTRTEEFKFLRQTTAALVDSQPLGPAAKDGGNAAKAATVVSSKSKSAEGRSPPACVPFLGMYLAQLYDHEKLPDFVDPSAPSEPVLIDPESGNLSSPSQPDVFSSLQALPGDLDLEPLINVHKQRLIAGVIKSFVAGQHLATNIRFDVDQKSWQKCFRLRSLESDELHTIAKTLLDA